MLAQGTGWECQTVSDMVYSISIVNSEGDLVVYDRTSDPALFNAARYVDAHKLINPNLKATPSRCIAASVQRNTPNPGRCPLQTPNQA